MSRRLTLSSPASRDLDEILHYVLENSGGQRASHVASRLQEAFQKLLDNPGLGHRREDLTQAPVLFYTVWSYFIIYNASVEALEIARIVHSARDVNVVLGDEPPSA